MTLTFLGRQYNVFQVTCLDPDTYSVIYLDDQQLHRQVTMNRRDFLNQVSMVLV